MPPINPWLDRRVINFAHEAGSWEAPSSTLFAMDRALEAGATALELDVHASADGHVVVSHDATVERTTNGTGAIAELTLSELQDLDNVYWFVPGATHVRGLDPEAYPFRGRAPDDPMFGIASLRQVLERYPGVVLNLDIKASAPTVPAYEDRLARLLKDFERSDDVIVASFRDPSIEAFSSFAPAIGTSAGPLAMAEFWRVVHGRSDDPLSPMRYVALQVPERFGELIVTDELLVESAHKAGYAVHVWTINEPSTMKQLVDLGVDGIFTDLPGTFSDILAARNVTWTGLSRPSASRRPRSGGPGE